MIHHITDVLHVPQATKILIYMDSNNMVAIFNMLRCLLHYNPILIDAADMCIKSKIQLRVLHIAGELNCVADTISRNNFDLARQYIKNDPSYCACQATSQRSLDMRETAQRAHHHSRTSGRQFHMEELWFCPQLLLKFYQTT